jgi:putative sigma-54 modulation protein
MKVNINSVHFKTDKKLDSFITGKLDKLSNYYDGLISSNVILKLDNSNESKNKIAEIRLIIKGCDLFAKKQCKSFEEAIDSAIEALRRQLKKHKEKLKI